VKVPFSKLVEDRGTGFHNLILYLKENTVPDFEWYMHV